MICVSRERHCYTLPNFDILFPQPRKTSGRSAKFSSPVPSTYTFYAFVNRVCSCVCSEAYHVLGRSSFTPTMCRYLSIDIYISTPHSVRWYSFLFLSWKSSVDPALPICYSPVESFAARCNVALADSKRVAYRGTQGGSEGGGHRPRRLVQLTYAQNHLSSFHLEQHNAFVQRRKQRITSLECTLDFSLRAASDPLSGGVRSKVCLRCERISKRTEYLFSVLRKSEYLTLDRNLNLLSAVTAGYFLEGVNFHRGDWQVLFKICNIWSPFSYFIRRKFLSPTFCCL